MSGPLPSAREMFALQARRHRDIGNQPGTFCERRRRREDEACSRLHVSLAEHRSAALGRGVIGEGPNAQPVQEIETVAPTMYPPQDNGVPAWGRLRRHS
jgi:hypothetical protein